jgi:indoleamine 2,3-dioxygenase
MNQNCWDIWPDRGFLMSPDPVVDLTAVEGLGTLITREAVEHLSVTAAQLPSLLEKHQLRPTLDVFPTYDMSSLSEVTAFNVVERLMQIYSYFASAYIYATDEEAAHHIPAGVARALCQLAQLVDRPPILSYTSYVLGNWRRTETGAGIEVDKLELIQKFLGNRDESWFILIHVDIETRAADALQGIQQAMAAGDAQQTEQLEAALETVSHSLEAMTATFARMPEACDSNVYYFKVRPYIFGFTNVVYEGVPAFGGQAQSFRGQTGAQSSIIPALVAAFGLKHEQTGLTQHLDIMKNYMPSAHRAFVARMGQSGIRDYVLAHKGNSTLVEVYNSCLRNMLAFRQMHLHYATTYIAEKVTNPLGTGGTIFMDWLGQLAQETEAQLI